MVREIKQFQDQASVGCAVTAGWPPLIGLGWLFEVHGACCGVGVGSFESWGRDLFWDIPQIDEIWIREIRRTGWWALSHCRGNSWVVFVVRRIVRSTAHIDENVSSGQWTQFLINKDTDWLFPWGLRFITFKNNFQPALSDGAQMCVHDCYTLFKTQPLLLLQCILHYFCCYGIRNSCQHIIGVAQWVSLCWLVGISTKWWLQKYTNI